MAGQKVTFGSHPRQYYQWYPAGSGKRPVVILVHGGGWSSGAPHEMETYVSSLNAKGWHCASIGYRYATEAKWPAQKNDVLAGVAAVSGRMEADESHLAVLGKSAGGLMAAHVALAGIVKCFVSQWGVLFTYSGPNAGDFDRLFADGYDRALANPKLLATDSFPPSFMHHGINDTKIPFSTSIAFRDRLRDLGVIAEHVRYSAGHGEPSALVATNRLQVADFCAEHIG